MEMRKNIPEKSDDKIYDFWLRTWRKAGTYLVPDPDNNWKQQIFGDISFEW